MNQDRIVKAITGVVVLGLALGFLALVGAAVVWLIRMMFS